MTILTYHILGCPVWLYLLFLGVLYATHKIIQAGQDIEDYDKKADFMDPEEWKRKEKT